MAAPLPSKAAGPDAKDVFDEDDLRFFRRQGLQADLAWQAMERGDVKPGKRGEYVAFHDGQVVGRGPEPAALRPTGIARDDVYILYLPGRDDVLVY